MGTMKRLIMLGALVLAGCGGDDTATKNSEAARLDAGLKFAKCMREHGVDMPDPKPDQHGGLGFVAGANGAGGPSPEKMDTAEKACRKYMEKLAPKLTPEREKEMQDQAVRFSACMRRHGIDMPDPQFGANGRITQKLDRRSGVDPASPAFQTAQKACGELMPKPRAVGGGAAKSDSD
jgi:hypothetical protein